MRQGFFEKLGIKEEQIKTKKKTKPNQLTCESCGLYKNCISPKMQPTGKNKKNIMILAECPGKNEDKENIQLIGDSGQVIRNKLKKLGYFLDRDFIKDNAVICRPSDNKNNNRSPSNKEINCCRKHVFETIEKYNPKVIIPMGKIALQSLLGLRIKGSLSDVKYSDWIGEIIPDQKLEKYICPVYHPSYIMRNDRDKVLDYNWERDLKKAIEIVDSPLYLHNYESDIVIIKDVKEAIKTINDFMDKNPKKRIFAFDYETTGRKPHRKGHRIISVSFSEGLFGYAFPFFDNEEFRITWKKLLTDDNSYCIAHNAYYEEMWTEIILGYKVKNWLWDTMIAQSIINNRKNTKLKFWVYAEFGVLSYDEKVEKYIKEVQPGEDRKSANSFNRLDEADINDVLLYNGQDALFTYKKYENQINQIGSLDNERFEGIIDRNQISKTSEHLNNGFNLFIEGFQRLLQAQQNGVRIDEDCIIKNEKKIKRKLYNIKESIYNNKLLNKWDKEKKFDFTKTNDLKHFLYNCLKIKTVKRTQKTSSPSLDHSALEKIDLPLVKDILEYRRWYKALSTYILQYKREIVNGVIHPFFSIGVKVITYRSSSHSPNLQNVINRDLQLKKIIRSFIIPREGNRLSEWDFKGMEISGAASIYKDPNLIEYLLDDSKDMHRDMAEIIFMMKGDNPLFKEHKLRYLGKNGFVFPSFYGSTSRIYKKEHKEIGAGDITLNIWERTNREVILYLKDKGIKNIRDFQEHIEKVEYDFWNDRFPVYAEGKKKSYKEYEKKGYVELPTGFRCYGPMGYNEVINYVIQGSCFHILLYTFNNVMRIMQKRKYDKSFIIGQIHDSILGDINPNDEEEIDYLVWKWGTQKVRERYPWIIVPLKIEKESSEINGSWADMHEEGYLERE